MDRFKYIIFTLSLLCITYKVSAQGKVPSIDQINRFKETTTLVVLNGRDVAFDAMLSEAIRKYWTITPYELINSERFERMKSNSAFSFLILTQAVFDNDKNESSYNFLNLLLAHPSGNINEMPVLAFIPFSGDPFTSSQHIYKTGMLIKAIQYQVNQSIQNPKRIKKRLSVFNRNIPFLKEKTLLIANDDIRSNLADSTILRKKYKSSIKVVSRQEIEKKVISETENFVALHKVLPNDEISTGRCYKMLIDMKTGAIYYYNMTSVSPNTPGKFLKKDFRKIRCYPFYWL